MRKSLIAVILLAGVLVVAQTAKKSATKTGTGKAGAAAVVVVTPDAIQWTDAPAALPTGAKLAVLSGNPNAAGHFVVRLKLPDGYRIMPHWHPTAENLTVISGGFAAGMGNKFDESQLKALPAGSYASIPAHHNHYAMTKGETELQVESMGPFKVIYVNPSDDPSKKK
jgi:quercetin dioxygenase-like cupin family protein